MLVQFRKHLLFLAIVSQQFICTAFCKKTAVDWLQGLRADGYEKLQTPAHATNRSRKTEVRVGVFVTQIGNFRAAQMDFEIDIDLGMRWTDKRLAHEGELVIDEVLIYDQSLLALIWRPDLYLGNAKDAKTSQVTVPNSFAVIYANGSIQAFTRIQATVTCNFDFRAFPFDEQKCPIVIMSYAGHYQNFTTLWEPELGDHAVRISDQIQWPELELKSMKPTTCTIFGDWSGCLSIETTLKRRINHYLAQTFLPTASFVLISWIAFWLEYTMAGMKLSIALTVLLTLTTLSNGIRATLPPAAYVKAVDVWMGACIAFVFATFFQIALVHVLLTRAQQLEKTAKELRENTKKPKTDKNDNDTKKIEDSEKVNNGEFAVVIEEETVDDEETAKRNDRKAERFKESAYMLDDASRVVFPFGFVTFACFFWFWYGFGNVE